MHQPHDILSLACKQTFMQEQIILLQEKERQIPGSVQYSIKRFQRHLQWNIEDTGMLVYHFQKNYPGENYLELNFCLSGNMYCRLMDSECNQCRIHESNNCKEKVESIDVLSFRFSPVHLSQFVKPRKGTENFSDDVISFRHHSNFSRVMPLCGKSRIVIDALLGHSYTDYLENIFINAQMQMLLLYSLDCMLGENEPDIVTCKFLDNEEGREKISKAREILIQHIGEPITIKELSRKAAINECYLKKGFKEMYGTTIFDFYQGQRMEHARYLLYEKGLSVTDVSLMLGYSSISHFSTAFKKHTGLKPCELLFR